MKTEQELRDAYHRIYGLKERMQRVADPILLVKAVEKLPITQVLDVPQTCIAIDSAISPLVPIILWAIDDKQAIEAEFKKDSAKIADKYKDDPSVVEAAVFKTMEEALTSFEACLDKIELAMTNAGMELPAIIPMDRVLKV